MTGNVHGWLLRHAVRDTIASAQIAA